MNRSLPYRPLLDVLVLAGLGAVVGVALAAGPVRAALPPATHDLLTLTAAGVGAGAAMLAVVAARLLEDVRAAWVAAALVLYSAVVLPWSTVLATQPGGAQRAPLLVTYLTAVVLLVLAIRPPAVLGAWGGWVIGTAGGLLGVLVLNLPVTAGLRGFAEGPVPTVVALGGWTAAAVAFAASGVRARRPARLRLGLGLVLLAVAQLYRVATPAVRPNLAFAGLRLLGLAVVLIGLAQLVQQALRRVRSQHWEHQEELAAAALHLERAREMAAERDHELRNGLAGLAGITHLLSAAPGAAQHEPLKHAVLAELGRLRTLVDTDTDTDTEPPGPVADGPGYPVQQVLDHRAALRSSAPPPGAGPLQVSVEPGLRAAGDPDVLAQVVTNLLANCDRHAPGTPITVTARRRDDRVLVEVRDRGPGLPAGAAEAVLERGVHDRAAGGSGLGLHISARLVAGAGGRLTLRTVEGPRGCLAEVDLPAVTGATSAQPLVADQRPSVVSSPRSDNR